MQRQGMAGPVTPGFGQVGMGGARAMGPQASSAEDERNRVTAAAREAARLARAAMDAQHDPVDVFVEAATLGQADTSFNASSPADSGEAAAVLGGIASDAQAANFRGAFGGGPNSLAGTPGSMSGTILPGMVRGGTSHLPPANADAAKQGLPNTYPGANNAGTGLANMVNRTGGMQAGRLAQGQQLGNAAPRLPGAVTPPPRGTMSGGPGATPPPANAAPAGPPSWSPTAGGSGTAGVGQPTPPPASTSPYDAAREEMLKQQEIATQQATAVGLDQARRYGAGGMTQGLPGQIAAQGQTITDQQLAALAGQEAQYGLNMEQLKLAQTELSAKLAQWAEQNKLAWATLNQNADQWLAEFKQRPEMAELNAKLQQQIDAANAANNYQYATQLEQLRGQLAMDYAILADELGTPTTEEFLMSLGASVTGGLVEGLLGLI
jgi:hypothetical protein